MRERALRLLDLVGEVLELAHEVVAQAEELDLLGAVGAGADLAQIFHLPPLGRALMAQPVGEPVEAELAIDGGEHRDAHQEDQQRCVNEEADGQCHGGDHHLHLTEHLAEDG